jgi:coenzyme A diphosphatase NUDT7
MRAVARCAATVLELTAAVQVRERARVTPFRRLGFVANEPWAGAPRSEDSAKKRPAAVSPAMGATPSVTPARTDPVGMAEVLERLRRYQDASRAAGNDAPEPLAMRTASVLVPLVTASSAAAAGDEGASASPRRLAASSTRGDEVRVLLCTRSEALSSHAGEVCLPGGKNDPGESDVACALREADEEIGLRAAAHALDVVATLPPFLSKGRVSVRPVVACVGSRTFEPSVNEDEVAETFTVPLESFLDEEGHSHRDWEFLPGRVIRVHFFERAGRVVWGLTASVLVETAEVAFGRRAAFRKTPPAPGGTDIQSIRSATDGEEEDFSLKKSERRERERRGVASRL